MSHSIEEYYRKIDVLHERAIELHRERYKTVGGYDKNKCQQLIDDIKYLANLIKASEVDMEREFGQNRTQHK
tara:strand:- start:1324 stop:1539 length:216 start_codon:yes stop_codon:yes gene_type:complete